MPELRWPYETHCYPMALQQGGVPRGTELTHEFIVCSFHHTPLQASEAVVLLGERHPAAQHVEMTPRLQASGMRLLATFARQKCFGAIGGDANAITLGKKYIKPGSI
eukprot:jgi/Phyca11/18265/fgenesh1_pg.PHYCAscaffold_35_\